VNKLRQTGAVFTLSLILAVSAFAGTIHSPGAKPPDPGQTTSTSSVSNPMENPMEISIEISTEIIFLTILDLIR